MSRSGFSVRFNGTFAPVTFPGCVFLSAPLSVFPLFPLLEGQLCKRTWAQVDSRLIQLPGLNPVLISSREPLVETVCWEWIQSHLRSWRTPSPGAGVVYCNCVVWGFHVPQLREGIMAFKSDLQEKCLKENVELDSSVILTLSRVVCCATFKAGILLNGNCHPTENMLTISGGM